MRSKICKTAVLSGLFRIGHGGRSSGGTLVMSTLLVLPVKKSAVAALDACNQEG